MPRAHAYQSTRQPNGVAICPLKKPSRTFAYKSALLSRAIPRSTKSPARGDSTSSPKSSAGAATEIAGSGSARSTVSLDLRKQNPWDTDDGAPSTCRATSCPFSSIYRGSDAHRLCQCAATAIALTRTISWSQGLAISNATAKELLLIAAHLQRASSRRKTGSRNGA